MTPLPVYVGWDQREQAAYDVAVHSLKARSSLPLDVKPLKLSELGHVLKRPVERKDGKLWCPISQAPMATEFAISRFCVPLLQKKGWALFTDCDVLCRGDIAHLFGQRCDKYAVLVVKHKHEVHKEDVVQCWLKCGCESYVKRWAVDSTVMACKNGHGPSRIVKIGEALKMDDQTQLFYERKNWSSVVLWNCDHKANKRLTKQKLNTWPGRDLHAFKWLDDDEIGELPFGWNWLVGVYPRVTHLDGVKLLHFTLGGPWLPDWWGGDYDDLWLKERKAVINAN